MSQSESRQPGRVRLALVHHANQYAITDGYADREGIAEILGLKGGADFASRKRGLLPLLQMHFAYQIPLNLHLSGTLIETLAWHHPESLALVRKLLQSGLIELVGSAFSQNVMPFFSAEYNRRQIDEELWLYDRHLEWDPTKVKTFWVPERVWNTEQLAPILASPDLLNGGYANVLLDDRLVFRAANGYKGSEREAFDRRASPAFEAFNTWTIADGHGLVLLPMSMKLRYLLPPSGPEPLERIGEMLRWLACTEGDHHLAVYGDDLERAAGVGGWDRSRPGHYEAFLQWLCRSPWIEPVRLGEWTRQHKVAGVRPIDPGTFFELARTWKAGEDYRGWHDDPNCQVHRRYLAAAEEALRSAEARGGDPHLLQLGWKHLLHCGYETSWHNLSDGAVAEPLRLAPWSAALTSQARKCRVIAAAADWCVARDGGAYVEAADVDDDGELEVVLKNDRIYAVCSPRWGGRLTYLFDLAARPPTLVLGNISDDWNLQEELNRYMDCPANHPGAFADVGHEHDRYEASITQERWTAAEVVLRNVEPGSALWHMEKRLRLTVDAAHVCVTYVLPAGVWRLSIDTCVSPDYHRLLREGRPSLRPIRGQNWRGWRNGATRTWLDLDARHSAVWDKPDRAECGHGLLLRVTTFDTLCHLDLGVGRPPRRPCPSTAALTREGRERLRALRLEAEGPPGHSPVLSLERSS